MKTKLIMLDTPIIVSDEKIKDEDTITNGVEIFKRNSMSEYSDEYANRYWQKIIAGIEGLPKINWNGLEEEFGYIDVEKLANQVYQPEPSSISEWAKDLTRPKRKAFINGFKKAQSLNEKKFSLEDMKKAIEMAQQESWDEGYLSLKYEPDYILNLIQQPKVFDIEVETEVFIETVGTSEFDFIEQDSIRPKITNNSIKILRNRTMTIHINKKTLGKIQIDLLNNFDLRSDLENNNIYDTKLVTQGYVGNRPIGFEGEFHEDDTWAIDCFTNDGMEVESYLYVSEYEYKQDLETLTNY